MSITMHTALYQKSDGTSQGVANFKTSVFKRNALSVPSLGQVSHTPGHRFGSILAPRIDRKFDKKFYRFS